MLDIFSIPVSLCSALHLCYNAGLLFAKNNKRYFILGTDTLENTSNMLAQMCATLYIIVCDTMNNL